jgi:peptidoglycan/xylan/chitin deacetylase (PgdA/CDA1 family)
MRNAVLMYHCVGSEYPDGSEFSRREFREHLRYVTENFEIVQLSEVLKTETSQRKVAITFDGGYKNYYTEALPVMREFDAPSTVYIIPQRIGKENDKDTNMWIDWFDFMTENQISDLANDSLVTIGNKTLTHSYMLTAIRKRKKLIEEVRGGKRSIEDRFGVDVDSFCYPSGSYDSDSVEVVRQTHTTAVTTEPRFVRQGEDPILIPRFDADLISADDLSRKMTKRNEISRHVKSYIRYLTGLSN